MVKPLPFDSPRWNELSTRMGRAGGSVAETLRSLESTPSRLDIFRELWPEFCSEDRTYEAAFAAAPRLVAFAEEVPRQGGLEYLIVLGLIATHADQVPEDLEPAYKEALARALALALDRLADVRVDHNLRYLLAAVAAFRGRTDLAGALANLDAIQEPCPSCGTVVFPSELQQIIERDQAGTPA
ncbi:MAG: hypothetical protein ABIO48_06075 [Pedococcus sp.]